MITLEVQRHIIAEVRVSTSSYPTNMTIEVRGSEIIFRARGCRTEANCLMAKQKTSLINNAVRALISDIYDYEADNVSALVLGLI
ncbi:hypothetical protein AU156_gp074 [Edwardsiella phage PEi20]|uniref:Uncharacterized protein n=1 Tax=Edwardsiella phage PEi20 TaxID=1608310 RepID=A0A0B6VQY9_9CAUD|nr:hypothetical protein AU156_gp074 [Edwardsiella phage PEi20]BAQ22724.1 conserved hypothetical protein [Edwardsiella phage PEi20]